MTEYMQRSSSREGYGNPVELSFKTDLMSRFHDTVNKEIKTAGCHYFAHNLIKNHLQAGHVVSSFYTDPYWQEKYWQDCWDQDPLDIATYTVAKINGCAITSWQIVDPSSDVMEHRKSMCKLSAGFTYAVQHDNGILENYSFGWEKYDVNQVTHQKLVKLSNMVTKFRQDHIKLNQAMFDACVCPKEEMCHHDTSANGSMN